MGKVPQSDTVPCQLNCRAISVFFGVKLQDPTTFNEATSSLKHIKWALQVVLSRIPVHLHLTENHDKISKQRNSKAKNKCSQSLHIFYSCYSQSERHCCRNQSCSVTSLLLLLPQLSTLVQITPSWVLAIRAQIRNFTRFKQQVPPHIDSCPLPSTLCPRYYTSHC